MGDGVLSGDRDRALSGRWRSQVEAARATFWRMMRSLEGDAPVMARSDDVFVSGAQGDLPARLYTPKDAPSPSPLVVFFHGGGFVVGGLDSHDVICRRLAEAARARVLSVGYRLAPEHKFPAAPDDAVAATRWAFANAEALEARRGAIAVAGDSAGGALAAVTALTLRRERERLAAMLLVYPCTQLVKMTPSQIRFRQAHAITQAAQDWFRDAYLPNRAAAHDWRCSPLLAEDFGGLPPTLLLTAGLDPLLDEGRAFAEKLSASGVAVARRHYPRQIHGFFNATAVSPAARVAIKEAGAWLRAAFRDLQ